MLEHIKEDEAVLKQMHRACKPNGGIILTVPQHAFLWSHVDEYACHIRRYHANDLKAKVKRAGFKVLRITSFVSILLPLLMISRLKKRKPDSKFDPTAEFRINRSMNTIFKMTLDFERSLIRLGFPFPVGGSLLLVARKISGVIP